MTKKLYFQLNQNIKANQIRVIGPEGENLNVLSKSEALKQAQKYDLDLVLIAPKAEPPVAKILDFRKFLYEKKREQRRARKGRSDLKELRVGINISDHDLNVRVGRAREFLQEGHKVKFFMNVWGRMITHKRVGEEKFRRILTALSSLAEYDQEPKWRGKQLTMILKTK